MPSRRAILKKLDALEPGIARAFREAVDSIRSKARLAELEAAIDAMDIERATRAAGITPAAWSRLTEEIRLAYRESGDFAASDAPARLGFQFDMNNDRAADWLLNHSSTMVTLIVNDQREAIRGALEAGLRRGANPRTTALDIAGRLDRRTGRRAGGIIGLTAQQSRFVENARQQLSSGDPAQLRAYLSRELRDRRFDSRVKAAIAAETPVKGIDQILARYSDRLLKHRGDTIARTESLAALNEASDESLRQARDEGLVTDAARIWDATGDNRTRETHDAAEGQERGIDEPFSIGGTLMMHPGDPAGGAANVINCRCVVRVEVDWVAQELAA